MLLFLCGRRWAAFSKPVFPCAGKRFPFFLKVTEQPAEATIVGGGSQWILQLQTGDPVGFHVQSVAFSHLFLQKPGLETLGLQDLMVRPGLAWRWGGSQETQFLLFLPASPRWAVRYGSDEGHCHGKWLGSCCGSLSQPWDGDSETHCCMHEG